MDRTTSKTKPLQNHSWRYQHIFRQTKTVEMLLTESGVWSFATQKPIKRPGWWNGKFTLFWMPAMKCRGRQTSL